MTTSALHSFAPNPHIIPLKTQAATAQEWIHQQSNLAVGMGKVLTADMKAYVKAIAAIANGTDTTSTVLPTRPTDDMETATITDTGTSSTTTASTTSSATTTSADAATVTTT